MTETITKYVTAYDNGKDVFLVYRDEKGKRKVTKVPDHPWYFCIDIQHLDKAKKLEQNISAVHIEEAGKYIKLFMPRDYDHEELRLKIRRALEKYNIKPLEFDLPLYKRYCVDNHIEVSEELRIGFYDIETDDSRGGIEIGRDRIISWAICDQEGYSKFFHSSNEREVLEELLKEIDKYDVICGWNSQEFDLPYIKKRMELYELSYNWKRIIPFDLMKRLIKLFGPMMTTVGLKGFSLEEVSQTFLGEGKVKHTEKIHELEKNDLKKLEEYNINDVVLLYKLDKKLMLFNLMIKECAWTGTFLNKFYVGELLDNYILREANKQHKHLGSQREYSTIRPPIEGAFVFEPTRGYHKKVRVFDFKSMYPSIFFSWNISPETLVEGVPLDVENYTKTPTGYFYSKAFRGVYGELVGHLLNMRKVYKRQQIESEYGSVEYNNAKSMQEVVKELSNSMYGITADPNSRFFDKRIAESITLSGQYLLKKCKVLLEELGYEVIYGDTDSLFCKIENDADLEPILKVINDKLKEDLMSNFNLMDYIIEIQYEKTFSPFVMVDKKRYTGLMTDLDGKVVNKIFTRGLEILKKDTIEFTRKKLFELLDFLLKEELRPADFFAGWFEGIKEEIGTSAITAMDLKITKKLSKPISEYKTKLPHVRLAEEKIKRQEILETVAGKHVWGQKIEYIIVNENSEPKTDNAKGSHRATQMKAIDYTEYTGEFDRVYYWNVQVYNVIGRILKVVFPEYPWDDMLIKKTKKPRKAKKKPDSI